LTCGRHRGIVAPLIMLANRRLRPVIAHQNSVILVGPYISQSQADQIGAVTPVRFSGNAVAIWKIIAAIATLPNTETLWTVRACLRITWSAEGDYVHERIEERNLSNKKYFILLSGILCRNSGKASILLPGRRAGGAALRRSRNLNDRRIR